MGPRRKWRKSEECAVGGRSFCHARLRDAHQILRCGYRTRGHGRGVKFAKPAVFVVRLGFFSREKSCQYSSVAQWQSIRLLTGGLLVHDLCESPCFPRASAAASRQLYPELYPLLIVPTV